MGSIVLGVDVHSSYAIIIFSAVHTVCADDPDRGTTTLVSYNLPHDNGTKSTDRHGEKTFEEISSSAEDHTDGKSYAPD